MFGKNSKNRRQSVKDPLNRVDQAKLIIPTLLGAAGFVAVGFPFGLMVLLAWLSISYLWLDPNDPDIEKANYSYGTRAHRIALWVKAFWDERSILYDLLTSLGAGSPLEDPTHGVRRGWFPPFRMAFWWSLFFAIPFMGFDFARGLLKDALSSVVLIPIPWWINGPLTVIAMLALFQTYSHITRKRSTARESWMEPELIPAPAVMLHKVSLSKEIKPALVRWLKWAVGSSLVIGLLLALVRVPLFYVGIVVAVLMVVEFFIILSRDIMRAYRIEWAEEKANQQFITECLSDAKLPPPYYVDQITFPIHEEWLASQEEMKEADPDYEIPEYVPDLTVATLSIPENFTYFDYQRFDDGLENRLSKGGAEVQVVTSSIPIRDDEGNEKEGTVGAECFRLWWSPNRISALDLLNPETPNYMMEFGVREVILEAVSKFTGPLVFIDAGHVTSESSSAQIIEILVKPASKDNVSINKFIAACLDIQSSMGIQWMRVFAKRFDEPGYDGTVTLYLGHSPYTKGIEFNMPPRIIRKRLVSADWMHAFYATGLVHKTFGPPRLMKTERVGSGLVESHTFELPQGLSLGGVRRQEEGLRQYSENRFLSVRRMKNAKLGNTNDEILEAVQHGTAEADRVKVVTCRADPFDRSFSFNEYLDRIIKPRIEGDARIKWHPGVFADDTLAVDSFDGDSAHLLIAGESGSGKSVTVQSMILQLAANNGPSDMRIKLFEPKIGLQRFANLDVVDTLVDSLTPTEDFMGNCAAAFQELVDEMVRRNRLMFQHPKIPEKLSQARKYAMNEMKRSGDVSHPLYLPFIIVFIEECAVLLGAASKEDAAAQGTILHNVIRLSREARSAGIHMVAMTQYPTNTSCPSIIREQMRRIGMGTKTSLASNVIIGQSGLEAPDVKKGVGMCKNGEDEYEKFKGLWLEDGDPDEIDPKTGKPEKNDIVDTIKNHIPTKSIDFNGNIVHKAGSLSNDVVNLPPPDKAVFSMFLNSQKGMNIATIDSQGIDDKKYDLTASKLGLSESVPSLSDLMSDDRSDALI